MAQPFVRITNSVVSSHRCVIFTCVSPDTDVSIRWFFNNKNLQLSRRMTLSPTKCGLRICPVRMENFGEYKCEVFNRVSVKTSLPVTFHWWMSGLSSHPSISSGYWSEKSHMVKLISYPSIIISMVAHIYNPRMHMCTREGQDLKWDSVSQRK